MKWILDALLRFMTTRRVAPEYISLTVTVRAYIPDGMDDWVVEVKGPNVDLTMTPEVARRLGEDMVTASLSVGQGQAVPV